MKRSAMRAMLLPLLLAHLALAAAAPAAAPTAAAATAATASFAASAHAVRRGGRLQVTNYKLEGDVTASTLQLTRFEVFSPTAQIVVQSSRSRPASVINQPIQANIAVESDYEFYSQFRGAADPVAEATNYIASLIGYGDLVYSREANMDLTIGYLRLWNTSDDPWSTTTSSSTLLNELTNYWNANMRAQKRTVVYMASGKSLGGGVAWMYGGTNNLQWNTACSGQMYPGSSADYSLCGYIGGSRFSWNGVQTSNPAAVNWDIMHAFGSPHTVDYCGIGGSAATVDNCYKTGDGCDQSGTMFSGNYGQLPTCSAPTPHWPSTGKGVIMSYVSCHLLGNGYSEVALTFGRGHTCGTAPERVANQIRDSVAARAAAYPDCFKAGSLVPPPPRPPPPAAPPPPPAAPPPPPAQGTWRNPVRIASLPFNAQLNSKDFPTDLSFPPLGTTVGKLGLSRPMMVYKFFAGASLAGRVLVLHSCHSTQYPASGDSVVTVLSAASETQAVDSAVGWTLVDSDDDACGSGQFKLTITLAGNTWYFIAASVWSASSPASYTLQAALQPLSPPPSPPPPPPPPPPPSPPYSSAPGTFANPHIVSSLPFVGASTTTYPETEGVPGESCGYLDGARPMRVYRLYADASMEGQHLLADSCRTTGDTVLTVLASPHAAGGSWTFCDGNDDGCGTFAGPFKMDITVTANQYYFILAFFAALPVNCTLYPSNGKPAYVFRWYSGAAPAGAKLVIQSCGTVVSSMVPLMSVRSSSYANVGPFTCLGYSSSGCAAGVPGFRLVLAAVPRYTFFRIAVHPVSTAPGASVRLNVALQLPPPPPPPLRRRTGGAG
ncbi:hypothetical protein COHA_004867 [Chlorella ohadii]|uniref:Peptidase M12B domain-containing protein n=1 Tax=Chlorella ohadii TaxID=2649997 RepID=A0AAD5H5C0_9CHLO|nr:hypothetical protein COHA_004867 [Chlorella ohadii]